MSKTNLQVKFKFGESVASNTKGNGDIIFDDVNKKIYARGCEFGNQPLEWEDDDEEEGDGETVGQW